MKDHGDEELYGKLESAYPSEDEDSEVRVLYISNFILKVFYSHQ